MKCSSSIAIRVVTAFALALAGSAAFAQPAGMGPMMHSMMHSMMHGMNPGTAAESHGPMADAIGGRVQQGDTAFAADMNLVHDLVVNNDKIKRTVTNLPNGIRTVTESDDPQIAQTIKAHVASMTQRLSDGKEFNLFSKTIPVLFENKDKIKTTADTTGKGSVVTQTSNDAKVVAALQQHATEVDELVRDGMVAMMRNAQASMMAMMPRGPRTGAGSGPHFSPPFSEPAR